VFAAIYNKKLLCRKYFANTTEGPIKQGMTVKVEAQFVFDCSIVVVGCQPSYLCLTILHWPAQLFGIGFNSRHAMAHVDNHS